MFLGEIIKDYRRKHKLTMQDFASLANISKQYVSVLERNKDPRTKKPVIPSLTVLKAVSSAMNIELDTLINMLDNNIVSTTPTPVNEIHKTIELLQPKRQEKVLEYAKNQLEEQNKIVAFEIKENSKSYKAVETLAKLSAGRGYAYGEDVETDTYYTNRDDLKPYDVASVVHGDSMTPLYNNGDVVLIRNGYDNVNGAVYAVDYNGESYLKRVYFEGNRLRLVSVNHNYKDIYIYLPIEDGVFLNIIGKVVDSFTPVN